MKAILAITAAALALATAAPASAETRQERAEARLAEMLEGRVAGEGRNCITAMRSERVRVIEGVGLVYDAGDTVYVARVRDPRMLDWTDVPIIERTGSQLCTTDIIRTVDRSTGHYSGAVFLEDFVPWTRPEQG